MQERLLKCREVVEIVSLSRASIYRLMKAGDFPRPIRLGPGSVRWKLSDIVAWVQSRPVGGSLLGPAKRNRLGTGEEKKKPLTPIDAVDLNSTGQVVRPSLHQVPPPVEQVRPCV